MRVISRKFSKFESENEGNIFESFGNPTTNALAVTKIILVDLPYQNALFALMKSDSCSKLIDALCHFKNDISY